MKNAIEILAAAKAIKEAQEKAARSGINPGKYDVDFVLSVKGTVTVGDDYEQKIVAKADAWAILAVALSKLNGVTVESLVREVAGQDVDTKAVKAQADAAIAAIKSHTVTHCNGKVTTDLTTAILEAA